MILYWFRNNLRLHDNPSLTQAIATGQEVVPVYVIDSRHVTAPNNEDLGMGRFRYQFLIESLIDLATSLERLGSKLIVRYGNPADEVIELAHDIGASSVYASKEVNPYETDDERLVFRAIDTKYIHDGFVYDPFELPFSITQVPMSFTAFRKKVEKYCNVRPELTTVEFLHSPDWNKLNTIPSVPLIHPGIPHDERSAHPFKGGEGPALQRVADYLWNSKNIKSYKATRNGLVGTEYSSKLSAFLALGCVSPAFLVHEIKRFEAKHGSNTSTYWLFFEVLWREFFRITGLSRRKQLFSYQGYQGSAPVVRPDEDKFNAWATGNTGHPFVDANMRELIATGFMSNRGRQNAASYLIHDLKQDWRKGASWFEKHLVDYDCSSNWGNWMYIAGVGNSRKDTRFDVDWQQRKYDSKGEYVRLWGG